MKKSANKRILMLLGNNPVPQDVRVYSEAVALAEAGYEVTIVAQKRKGQPYFDKVDGINIIRYPAPPKSSNLVSYIFEFGYSLIIAVILSMVVFMRDGFDVIHAHNPPDIFVLVALFYKLFGKQFVFDHHDLSPEVYQVRSGGKGNRLIYKTLLWFERLSCKVADHVIATNESYKRIEMRRGDVPEEKITVVRNGPNLNHVKIVDPIQKYRDMNKTILGYVGLMGVQDGLDYLLRALAHLRHDLKREDFHCMLIGGGSELENLKKLTSELKIDEYVEFVGFQRGDDLNRYLSTADICVDPDPVNEFNDHSTMIKMAEYMALGKPIVAFDLTEHQYTAQSAAIYVADNDEILFAQSIEKLMDDPQLRSKMGRFGRQRVENVLAWKYSVKQLLKAYQIIMPSATKESLIRM
jgi:glycosyltransferase involved in cell wall biosynthesis